MMVQINGERRDLPDEVTAAKLVELLGLAGKRLAIEVNEEIVPRSRFAHHHIRDGDRVEIVRAIGGG